MAYCRNCTLAAGLTFSVTSANADTIADNNSQVDSNVQQTQVIKNSNDVDSNSGQQAFSSAVSNQNEVSTGSQTNSISTNTQSYATATTTVNYAANANEKNGWVKQSDGTIVYYRNGQLDKGREYVQLDSLTNPGNKDWYLLDNGVATSGVQKWMGTYYYFDPVTKLRVDNKYVQSQWGLWYMFGSNGQIASGKYDWQGSTYYFDPSSYLKVSNDYRVTERDGRGVLLGSDGRALSGVQKWAGTYYYFDPVTKLRVDNNYVQSQWGDWYMFGNDGRIVQGFYNWKGTLYFFDPSSYLVVKNTFFNGNGYWGDWDVHYADGNGAVHSVTYFSQFRPINAPEGCAAASLAMLLSIKNEWPSLSYLYATLPQYGGVYSVANFRGILSIDTLAAYAQKFDANVKNLKGASLGNLSNIVLSGHPVLYYGWSSYETVWTGRNHAKLIIGAHNGLYHVIDPCYFYRSQGAHTMGGNRYDWGADSWRTWGDIASEYAGSALTLL